MSLYNVFDISGSGMSAQNVRLNTTASNISNANTISSSQDKTYRARHPVFAAELMKASESTGSNQGSSVGVKVLGIVESDKPLQIEYNQTIQVRMKTVISTNLTLMSLKKWLI